METCTMYVSKRDGKYEAEILSDYDDSYVGAYNSSSLSDVCEYARKSGFSVKCNWTYVR